MLIRDWIGTRLSISTSVQGGMRQRCIAQPNFFKRNFLKRINVIWAVQPHLQKYFRSRLTQITSQLPLSRPKEGRIAIVTDAGRDAVDAAAPARTM
jgi:hypothetical protein